MKQISLFLLVLFFFAGLHGNSQINLTVVYAESYNIISFKKQRNINDFDRKEYLYTNGDSVSFFSFSLQKPEKKEYTVGSKKDHHSLFIFPKLNRGLSENYWVKPYNLSEFELPSYNWQTHDDTMRIAGYLCKVGVADGVVAWFTEELAMPFGPMTYYGLPGLILMVEDHRHKRLYKAESVSLQGPEIVTPDLDFITCKKCESKLEGIKKYFNH